MITTSHRTLVWGAALMVLATTAPIEAATLRAKGVLTPTGIDADARGRTKLTVSSSSEGKFEIVAQRLDRDAAYDLIVGGVRVAGLRSTGSGSAKARFSTRVRGRDLPLGFDPRATTVVLRGAAGDVLVGVIADPVPGDDGDVVCCIPDDSGPECEDRTPAECAAQGGVEIPGAGSCLPNPCADVPPPVGQEIVCCLPDDSGPECEDRTSSQCLGAGGVVVSATSCATNPCAATPSPAGDVICCLPDRGGDGANECEDLSPEACTTAGGTASSATSCTPDPCNAGVAARHGRGADDPLGDDRRVRRNHGGSGRGGHDDGPNHR